MHVLPTSNVKFSAGPLNHTFLGIFSYSCLKTGSKFGRMVAPYGKVRLEQGVRDPQVPRGDTWHINRQGG